MSEQPLTCRVGGWLVALLSVAALPIEFPGPVAGQPPKGDYPMVGLIGERYKKLGGPNGPLGRPTSKEMDARGGRRGRYQPMEPCSNVW